MKQATRMTEGDDQLDEQAFGRRIAACLNASTHELDDHLAARLQAARNRALAAHHPRGGWLRLPAVAGLARGFGGRLGQGLAVAVVAAVVLVANPWSSWSDLVDLADIDAALLADELPIDAYLDSDFTEWLQQDSRS